MRANYKFLTDIDLSSNIIANVSKIIGNDYSYNGDDPSIDINDLIITTCDSSISADDDNTANNNTAYRGDVLIRAGVAEDTSNSGYVHIFAGVEDEINANKIVPEDATTDWADEDGIRVCPTGDLRFSDPRIRSYFTDEFEIHGSANNLDNFHTLYKVDGKFTKFELKENTAADPGASNSENGDTEGDTIRHVADYFRIDTLNGSKKTAKVGFIDLDTYDFDLYSENNINIHTESRGSTSSTVKPTGFKSGQSNPVFATDNKTTITTSYLAENAANIIIDNSDSFITYTGNKYEVYVGSYKAGTTTARPTGSDRALYLKLDNSVDKAKDFTVKLVNNTADNKSWGNGEEDGTFSADDFLDARADIIRLTATGITADEAAGSNVVSSTTDADGLIQLNAGYLDAKVNTLLGIDTANLNIIARTSHIRAAGADTSNLGLLHLLHSTDPSDENTLKGIIIYDETVDSARYNGITLGTNEKITERPTVFVETGKVTSAFMYLTKDTINEWSTNTNLDIERYLKFKVGDEQSEYSDNITTLLSSYNGNKWNDLSVTTGETSLDINQGLTRFITDDLRINIHHNTEIRLEGSTTEISNPGEDYLFDIYLDEYNEDDKTSAITSSTKADSTNLIKRKFSIARENFEGTRWKSEENTAENTRGTAVVGRIDNFKVNKVFNMGMNEGKFSIYWDNYTSSLVFTQGEILWQ